MARKPKPTPGYTTVLNEFFSSPRPLFTLSNRLWNPPTDIIELPDRAIIKMEVAGVPEENLEVTAHGRRLIVKGWRSEPKEETVLCYHLMEVQYGEFRRVFEFPYAVEMDSVEAKYENGFLRIEVPKELGTSITIEIISEEQEPR